MPFTKAQIAQACKDYAPQLSGVPSGLDPAQVLWAISGNESSFGMDCRPRHEPAFDVGGRYGNNWATEKFGSLGACSFGPWQIMLVNCPTTYTPDDMNDLNMATVATILFMSKQFDRWHPDSLNAIGAIWNGGNPSAANGEVVIYQNRLQQNYLVPLEGQ